MGWVGWVGAYARGVWVLRRTPLVWELDLAPQRPTHPIKVGLCDGRGGCQYAAADRDEGWCGVQVVRDKNVAKPAPGKRKCNCKQKVVTQQVGPGMYQQYTKQVCCTAKMVPHVKDVVGQGAWVGMAVNAATRAGSIPSFLHAHAQHHPPPPHPGAHKRTSTATPYSQPAPAHHSEKLEPRPWHSRGRIQSAHFLRHPHMHRLPSSTPTSNA